MTEQEKKEESLTALMGVAHRLCDAANDCYARHSTDIVNDAGIALTFDSLVDLSKIVRDIYDEKLTYRKSPTEKEMWDEHKEAFMEILADEANEQQSADTDFEVQE